MDIRALTEAVTRCLLPNSPTRSSLTHHLDQLLDTTVHLKQANVEATSLLSHITLTVVRIFTPAQHLLSDKERELALKCLHQALTLDPRKRAKRMVQVHAIIIDHLSRILVPLFAVTKLGGSGVMPEDTRYLAIECWRAMVTNIESVHVPQTQQLLSGKDGQNVMMFDEYARAHWPPGYLSLSVCELIDNGELAQKNQDLRRLALDTLSDIQNTDYGVLGSRDVLLPMFPGIASTLARIALAQQPKQRDAENSSWKMPLASVRSSALLAFRKSLTVLFSQYSEDSITADIDTASMIKDWAQRARKEADDIIGGSSEDSIVADEDADTGSSNNEDSQRLLQILWRLAGLRHSESIQITHALFSFFVSVALDCKALQSTACFSIAIDTGLVLSCAQPNEPLSIDFIERLTAEYANEGVIGRQASAQMEKALPLFEQYIGDGTDQQRKDVLCLVSGHIQALGRSRSLAILSSWWKDRGLLSFLNSLAISLPGTSLLITDVSEMDSLSKSAEGGKVPYVLGHYRGAALGHALSLFIEKIAWVFTEVEFCAQLLSLLLDQSLPVHSQALWLMTQVVSRSGSAHLTNTYQSFFQYCIDYFDQPKPIDSSAKGNLDVSAVDDTRTLESSLVLNAIASIIPTVGSSVTYYLDILLFPLLQTTTSDTALLKTQARHALAMLAQTVGLHSIADLIKENMDYIVEGCAQQIRTVEMHPSVFYILTGAVQLAGEQILPYMDDVTEDTLDVCEYMAADSDGKMVASALEFLEAVTRTVASSHKAQLAASNLLEDKSKKSAFVGAADADPIGKVLDELESADAFERMAEFTIIDNEPATDVAEPAAAAADEDEDQPGGNPLAIKISLVTQNFLTSDSPSHQLLSLKILQNTMEALQNTKDLLPLINEVWPALVHRLSKDRDAFYVSLAACDVIETVCQLGEDWMRRRVRDDLWVHLRRILSETTAETVDQRGSERELVIRVLRTMRTVVCQVPLDDHVSWDLSWLAARLLGSAVDSSTVELLQAMVPVYGDKIWLVLAKCGLTNDSSLQIPNLGIPVAHVKAPHDICQLLGL
ncbi:hypothetical protein GGI25_004218 [Coemansia spiralis]|uniref:TTI1 C-terminal TPR domain-containing protein n=2 Tax=Coemansia TaxID=4863 RepID=A0A9W8G733_9FUNG|nr:hypothetical protein EDC05_004198 [Coemansia umbellata]KAJ2624975.1 hypothetical protein GGI26_001087 [Coemansia sp. RSA 1358]KAJ2674831.1 hypothetical protein GGI25_004218 [Coemansia spiralis]